MNTRRRAAMVLSPSPPRGTPKVVKGAASTTLITLQVDPAELASILSALDSHPVMHSELIPYLERKLAAHLKHRAARRASRSAARNEASR